MTIDASARGSPRRRSPPSSPDGRATSTGPRRCTGARCAPRWPPRRPTIRDWRRLLAHLDNDAARLTELLVGLLAQRDQWLPLLVGGEATRAALERRCAAEIEGELAVAAAAFPAELAATLARLLRHAADQLADDPEAAVHAAHRRRRRLPGRRGRGARRLARARRLAARQVGRAAARDGHRAPGLSAAGRGAGAAERAQAKADMLALLAALAAAPGFADALDAVRALPRGRLRRRRLGGRRGAARGAAAGRRASHAGLRGRRASTSRKARSRALQALGGGDDPQDLLLRLDAAVAHLLVDEFQDTSFAQLELVSRLTSGWTPGDGRTLFAVGDPMQSIYRFRDAEVRLFVEAQQRRRIGGVPVEPLALRRNFRSQAGLVDWVNAVFPAVLGARSDPWQGAVAFAPAVAEHASTPGAAATLDLVADPASEAGAVVAAVRAALADGAADVALLVRARRHLDAILPALRGAGSRSAPSTSTRSPSGRRSAISPRSPTRCCSRPTASPCSSVLRAPWCGARAAGPVRGRRARRNGCRRSPRGDRLPALPAHRRRTGAARSLRRRVRPGAARARGRSRRRDGCAARGSRWAGRRRSTSRSTSTPPSVLRAPGAARRGGDVADWAAFVDDLAALRAGSAPRRRSAAAVQVMTLHRAKGLEFDTVIIAGLGRRPPRGDRPLLLWRRRPQGLLLAPARRRGGEPDPCYDYLAGLDEREKPPSSGGCSTSAARAPAVASTSSAWRARLRGEDGATAWKAPPRGSALARLWPGLAGQLPPPPPGDRAPAHAPRAVAAATAPTAGRLAGCRCLPARPGAAAAAAGIAAARRPSTGPRRPRATSASSPIACFAQLAREGLGRWDAARVARERARLRQELASEGVAADELDDALVALEAAVGGVLASERGRWLFAPGHASAASEWALAGSDEATGAIVHVVARPHLRRRRRALDRRLQDRHATRAASARPSSTRRWSATATSSSATRGSSGASTHRPIRLALYLPALRGWRDWAFAG